MECRSNLRFFLSGLTKVIPHTFDCIVQCLQEIEKHTIDYGLLFMKSKIRLGYLIPDIKVISNNGKIILDKSEYSLPSLTDFGKIVDLIFHYEKGSKSDGDSQCFMTPFDLLYLTTCLAYNMANDEAKYTFINIVKQSDRYYVVEVDFSTIATFIVDNQLEIFMCDIRNYSNNNNISIHPIFTQYSPFTCGIDKGKQMIFMGTRDQCKYVDLVKAMIYDNVPVKVLADLIESFLILGKPLAFYCH